MKLDNHYCFSLLTFLNSFRFNYEKVTGSYEDSSFEIKVLTGSKFMKKLILFTLLIFNYSLSMADVRYVGHTGSNTPPYLTWETAADSIMSAINVSSFGDTIYVANGVYEEVVDMVDGVTLIGAGSDSCVIDTRNIQDFPGYSVNAVDSCTFSSFKIRTKNKTLGTGVYVTGGKNTKIGYCFIQETKYGITITAPYQNSPLAYKNIIRDITYGITTSFSQAIIQENVVYSEGVSDGLVSGLNSNATFINNTVICSSCGKGYSGSFSYSSKVKNNLFYGSGNSAYGIYSYGDTIINNIVFGRNGGWGDGISGAASFDRNNHIENTLIGVYYDVGGGPPPDFKYNNLWHNQSNYQNFTGDSTNINSDPMFDNPDSMDFHLQKYSPLIDAGDPAILDLDGSRSDIGLFGGPYGERYAYQDLPPRAPVNISAVVDTEYIIISWNRNTEADFSHYNLYRDTTENFTADSTTFVASIEDTFYLHIRPEGINNLYFKLTAEDNQGNVSEPSEELQYCPYRHNER